MLECISQKFKAAEATLEVEQVLTQLPVDIGYSLTTTHNNSQRNVLNSIFRPILRTRKSNFGYPLFWRPLSAEASSSKAVTLKFFSSSGLAFELIVQPINFYKHICIFHCTIFPFWAQCNIYCCTLYGHGKRTPYPPPIPLVFCRRRPRKLEEPREMGLFKNKRLGVPHWHTLEFRRPDTFFSSNCHLHWNCPRF